MNLVCNIKKSGMVGFEPTGDGVKDHCLTTWRHPKIELVAY